MADEFIYCPMCGSKEIAETDYEDLNGEIDIHGRACLHCRWEGSVEELVCKE